METQDHFRVSMSDIFLEKSLNKDAAILDVACGVGIVAEEIGRHGYLNVDGLDPVQGYLDAAQARNIYQRVFKAFVEANKKLPIEDDTYDVVMCCAGFFQGLISPLALTELARVCKPGGLIMWNIAEGFESYGRDFERHDAVVDGLVADGVWSYSEPVRRFQNLVFTDSGAALLGGYNNAGLATQGMVYIMRKSTHVSKTTKDQQ